MARLVHSKVERPASRPRPEGGDAAIGFIVDQIRTGIWPTGQKLPTERELARQFGVARNTLRKGLDTLRAEGLIRRHVGNGTFVADSPTPSNEVPDPSIIKLDGASPADIMEFRLTFEPQVAELAVRRATESDLCDMEVLLDRAEAAANVAEFEFWDGAFHVAIVKTARNRVMTDVYGAINMVRNQALWGKMKERSLTPDRRHLYQTQHRLIAQALRSRDLVSARNAVRIHLIDVRDALLEGSS